MKLSFAHTFDRWPRHATERPVWKRVLLILGLLLIGCLAFFWNLGSTGLLDETEPLFAEAAREMLVTGDWITPFFDGVTRFDKPILIYWLMAIAYKILGVNEWAARLPSALSAMGLTSLVFYTLWSFGVGSPVKPLSQPGGYVPTRRYWFCAGLGSALMMLNLGIILPARLGLSDMLLTACMDGAMLSFFMGYAQPAKPAAQLRWYLAFYVLAALAVLTKGPVGIVLPGLIIGVFVLYLGNGKEVWQQMRPLWGGLVFIAIALPWYVLVIQANGWAYINSFFIYHNFERFTTSLKHVSLQVPWYFYLMVVMLSVAPWSVYLPVALVRLKFWRRDLWRSSPRSTHLGLFVLVWLVGVLVFFSTAATKLPSYVLPALPAVVILVALMWSDQLTRDGVKRITQPILLVWSGWLNVVFLLAIAAAFFYVPHWIGSDPAILNPRQLVEQSGLPKLAAIIWGITAVAVAVLLWQRRWRGMLGINLLGFVAFVIFVLMPTYFLIDQARQLPLRELSSVAVQVQQPGEPLIAIGFKKPSIVFYTQRHVDYFLSPKTALEQIKEMAIASGEQPSTVLILSQPKKWQQMGLQPPEYQNLGEAGAYQLIRVSKMVVLQKQ